MFKETKYESLCTWSPHISAHIRHLPQHDLNIVQMIRDVAEVASIVAYVTISWLLQYVYVLFLHDLFEL